VTETEFLKLPENKKTYAIARLYLLTFSEDAKKGLPPFKKQFFMLAGWLRKQPPNLYALLFSYMSQRGFEHGNVPLWSLISKATVYDQRRRREAQAGERYKEFDEKMLHEALGCNKLRQCWKQNGKRA